MHMDAITARPRDPPRPDFEELRSQPGGLSILSSQSPTIGGREVYTLLRGHAVGLEVPRVHPREWLYLSLIGWRIEQQGEIPPSLTQHPRHGNRHSGAAAESHCGWTTTPPSPAPRWTGKWTTYHIQNLSICSVSPVLCSMSKAPCSMCKGPWKRPSLGCLYPCACSQ